MAKHHLFRDVVERREPGAALVEAILEVYVRRFGPAPAELSAALRQTHDGAVLRECLSAVATGTPEEVLAVVRRGCE